MEKLTLADGRVVEYLVEGPSDAMPLVFHHGTPTGAVRLSVAADAAAKHGLRLITHGRPGYGGSQAQPGRTVSDVAGDVAAILDALGADQFVTVGWSGGGPHALACAALLPGRCLAAATLAGVAPYGAKGLNWLDGMGDENIAEFGAAEQGEGALTAYLEGEANALRDVTPADMSAALGDLIGQVDRDALQGSDLLDFMVEGSHYSVSHGVAGWRDDDLAFIRDWGFDLGALTVPVAIWQGDQDRMVPFAHGQWLAANVTGADVHLEPGEGHLSLVRKFDTLVADLVAKAARR